MVAIKKPLPSVPQWIEPYTPTGRARIPSARAIGGRQGIKKKGDEIMPVQVAQKRQEIIIKGNKRVIIEIEDISRID